MIDWTQNDWQRFPGLEEHLRCQLSLLDAYERLLDGGGWDKAELNDMVKAGLSASLFFMRAQAALNEQMVAACREGLDQYRRLLETALAQHAGQDD